MNNDLQHWGIKGMRWGVRRYQNSDGSLTAEGRRRYADVSDDALTAYRLNNKRVRSMSNAELRNLNERMRLEQEYARMHPSAYKRGMDIAGNLASGMETFVRLYSSGSKVVGIGKDIVKQIKKRYK